MRKKENLQWTCSWFKFRNERFQTILWAWNGSSGLSHVPSQPMSNSKSSWNDKPGFLLAACHTELIGTTRHVFEDLLAPSDPPAAFFGIQVVLNQHNASLCLWKLGDLPTERKNWKETLRILQYLHRSSQLGILPLMQKEPIRRIACLNRRGIKSWKCISINSLILRHFSVGKRASRPTYVPVLTFPRMPCCGSKRWRWLTQWTILRRRNRLEGIDSRILRWLMRRLRLHWRRSSPTPTARRESIRRSKRHKCKTDCSV